MIPKVREQNITDQYAIYNGDSCEVLRGIPKNSLGFSVFSPPFADLYSYSDDIADLSNSSYKEFFDQFHYLLTLLDKALMPGRVVAIHCFDIPTFKRNNEEIGLKDFSGDIIRLCQKIGWIFHSRHCIWKDPLLAATRTKAIGLAHKQIVKDSSVCRMGIPDYIVAFRKKGDNPKPIIHPKGLTEYHGERSIPNNLDKYMDWEDQKTNKRSHWIWQRYASPVWDDICQTKVLQYKKAKDADDQRHICPLQLQTVYRCLTLWSNPGDTVLTPFMGIGTEIYCAVKMGRRGVGIELKPRYYRQAVRNIQQAARESTGTFSGGASNDA